MLIFYIIISEIEAFDMHKMMKDVRNEIATLSNNCGSSVLIIEGILIFNHKYAII